MTITGMIVNPDGSLASGGMQFTLSSLSGSTYTPQSMTDSSTGEVVAPVTIAGVVIQGHLLSPKTINNPPLQLFATDDPTSLPTGLVYEVVEDLAAGSVGPWSLVVSHTQTSINIGSQRPT